MLLHTVQVFTALVFSTRWVLGMDSKSYFLKGLPVCVGHAIDAEHHFFLGEEKLCEDEAIIDMIMTHKDSNSCGLRDVLVKLSGNDSRFSPSMVTVKRCIGHCEDDAHTCGPVKAKTAFIAVNKMVKSTSDIHCGIVEVEEHTDCACACRTSAKDCNIYQRFIPSKCKCECAPKVDVWRAQCKAEGDDRYWDEASCQCICPRRTCPPGEEWVAHRCRCLRFLD